MVISRNKQAIQSLSDETREAANSVFEALSNWRDEVSANTERYSEVLLEKMAIAAKALGWPKELVEASRQHLAQASKMQIQMLDQLVEAWQRQLKSPAAGRFLAQLGHVPGASPNGVGEALTSPIGLWMQTAEMWQRKWAANLSVWAGPNSHAREA